MSTAVPVEDSASTRQSRTFSTVTPIGRWAAGLGIATVVWGLSFTVAGRLLFRMLFSGGVRPSPMILSIVVEIVLTVAALTTGILAWRTGERSWLFLAAFFAAVILGGFWTVFAAGELILPH